MELQKLTALLALGSIEMHAGLFGNKKPFAKLDEDQLQTVEAALAEKDTTALQQELAEAQATVKRLENAVEQALAVAGVSAGETLEASIVALGETCQKYGGSKERHTFAEHSGKDEEASGLVAGYLDPNDEHNQLLKSL